MSLLIVFSVCIDFQSFTCLFVGHGMARFSRCFHVACSPHTHSGYNVFIRLLWFVVRFSHLINYTWHLVCVCAGAHSWVSFRLPLSSAVCRSSFPISWYTFVFGYIAGARSFLLSFCCCRLFSLCMMWVRVHCACHGNLEFPSLFLVFFLFLVCVFQTASMMSILDFESPGKLLFLAAALLILCHAYRVHSKWTLINL